MKKLFIIAFAALGMLSCTTQNNPDDPEQNEPYVSNGLFSVSENTQVQFSPGNLQYRSGTDTWRFAEHQYDIKGMANVAISSPQNFGWIDLFGWGTGNNPTEDRISNDGYPDFVDWGSNAISNGGNVAGHWRTLTLVEWDYLFTKRANAANLYGFGNINGINGIILLPDDWIQPSGIPFGNIYKNFDDNTYTLVQWGTMESAGAVFLPAAGFREMKNIKGIGSFADYWSSTKSGSFAYYWAFQQGLDPHHAHTNRGYGFSVRLVH